MKRDPYKRLVPNTALRTNLLLRGSCSRIITAIGSANMARFDVKLTDADIIRVASIEIQCPGRNGFHNFSRGTHVQIMVGVSAIKTTTLNHSMNS